MPPFVRSAFAVFTGFMVITVVLMFKPLMLRGFTPPGDHPTSTYLAMDALITFIAVSLGGYFTAVASKTRPIEHAAALGGIVFLLHWLAYRRYTGGEPIWYVWLMGCVPPFLVLTAAALYNSEAEPAETGAAELRRPAPPAQLRATSSANPSHRAYGSLLPMAQNGRFGLSVRVLTFLALAPDSMHTSASIAASLHTSPVMVRRVFSSLHKAGFLLQRKGPQGGARLKIPAKSIGLGEVFAASGGLWPTTADKALDALLKRTHADAVTAMNDTTIASLAKKLKKA